MKRWTIAILALGLSHGYAQDPDESPAAPSDVAPTPPNTGSPADSPKSMPESVPDLTPMQVPESSVVDTFGPSNDDEMAGNGGDTFSVSKEDPNASQNVDGVPQVYVIEQGDTLWDICQKMLDNPWYWPKLWSLNEYITNPHLISPGKELHFYPGSGSSFPTVKVVDPNAVASAGEEQPRASETMIVPSLAIARPDMDIKLRMVSFLDEKELKTLGRVKHSVAPKMELSYGDLVYLSFNKKTEVSIGAKYHVLHKISDVDDPNTSFTKIGALYRKAAVVEVTKITGNKVEAKVMDNYESIRRGDPIVPYTPPVKRIVPIEASTDVKGQIIASENMLTMIGSQDFVFLNVGRKNGISDGQKLTVVKRGDGLQHFGEDQESDLPDVEIGRLMVVDTYERTSMAYILSVNEELEVGARVKGKHE